MSSVEKCPECGGYRGLPRILHHDQDNPKECDHVFHSTEAPIEVAPEPAEVLQFPTAQQIADAPPPEPKPVIRPVCPYCGSEEGRLVLGMTNIGPFQVAVVRCGKEDCRKILFGFQALQMQTVPPGMPPGLTH